jgi:hypothetical protein
LLRQLPSGQRTSPPLQLAAGHCATSALQLPSSHSTWLAGHDTRWAQLLALLAQLPSEQRYPVGALHAGGAGQAAALE